MSCKRIYRYSAWKDCSKITWVLRLIETQEKVPRTYFKNLSGTKIYECRIEFGGNIL